MDFVNLQILPPWSYSTFMMVIYYIKECFDDDYFALR